MMEKNEKVELESEEMLEIIHNNHKTAYEKNLKRAKAVDKIQNLLIFAGIVLFIVVAVFLTIDRKQAIKNCEKNHSRNYCERISG